jgi:hypothetical protein
MLLLSAWFGATFDQGRNHMEARLRSRLSRPEQVVSRPVTLLAGELDED